MNSATWFKRKKRGCLGINMVFPEGGGWVEPGNPFQTFHTVWLHQPWAHPTFLVLLHYMLSYSMTKHLPILTSFQFLGFHGNGSHVLSRSLFISLKFSCPLNCSKVLQIISNLFYDYSFLSCSLLKTFNC